MAIPVKFPAALEFLEEDLSERKRRNAAYSLRAYARDLGVSTSLLSQLFNGHKPLTEKTAARILPRLGWDTRQRKIFIGLVRLEQTVDEPYRQHILEELKPHLESADGFYILKDDVFRLIHRWYHQAILELTRTNNFDPAPKAIANRLGISRVEVEIAIARLQRLGLLCSEKGTLVPSQPAYSISDIPSQAIRNFHLQNLELARDALEAQSLEERDFSGITMAIDSSKIPKAKEMIREFRRRMMAELEDGERDQVYQLSIQLFRTDDGRLK